MYEPAIFIKTFVTDLDTALSKLKPNAKLTQLQRMWLGFCLMGTALTLLQAETARVYRRQPAKKISNGSAA
jgi:hypothetical protein